MRVYVRLRSAKSSLKLPDALVLATADLVEADLVITGDERHTKVTADRWNQ